MNTQNSFSDTSQPGLPPTGGPSRPQPYQFTNEELRVLRECNRDSFFQRCLPIGTALGIAAYYGVQAGHLKPSQRWGATPKVLVASIIGYFIGKISYQTKCAEKLMQLPDSRLGAILRQRKRGAGFQESLDPGFGAGMSLSPFTGMTPSNTYSDIPAGPSNSLNIDTNRPDQHELDDTHRPTIDDNHPIYEEESMPIPQNKTTSYDELRKLNREEYQNQRNSPYKGLVPPTDVPPVRRPQGPSDPGLSSTPSPSPTPSPPKRTNIYGDVME